MTIEFFLMADALLLALLVFIPICGEKVDARLKTATQTYGRNTQWRSTPFPGPRMKILPWKNP